MTATTTTATSIVSFGRRRMLPHLYRQTRGLPSSLSVTFSTSTPTPTPTSSSSSSSSWVTTEILEHEQIAVLQMHRKPANALSLEMCAELSKAIQTIEEERTATAMVLTSSLPNKIFSAGLDISTELYKPDLDRLPKFWWNFQQLFLDLYGSTRLTTVAALEGPSPAAGCMLALSCDYRIMAHNRNSSKSGGGWIGLNESHLGIVAPPWMCQQYIDVLGHRTAEISLLSGLLFPPEEARDIGLVDELVQNEDVVEESSEGRANNNNNTEHSNHRSRVEQAAIRKAKEFARIPHGARAAVKELTRRPLVDTLTKDREKDVDFFCEFVTSEKVQAAIGTYMEALASKKKKE